jgi:hypothetical protein
MRGCLEKSPSAKRAFHIQSIIAPSFLGTREEDGFNMALSNDQPLGHRPRVNLLSCSLSLFSPSLLLSLSSLLLSLSFLSFFLSFLGQLCLPSLPLPHTSGCPSLSLLLVSLSHE